MTNLVDYTFFKRTIFIGNVSDPVVMDLLGQYIKKYQKEFLVKLLGLKLYNEFEAGLLLDPVPQIWTDLINILVDEDIKESPIANYVYYYLLESENTTNSGIGVVRLIGENSENVSLWDKSVRSWNDMVEMICGIHQRIKENNIYPSYKYQDRSCICKEVYSSCGCSKPVFGFRNTLNF